jgi:anti-sigma factor RsiW
MSQDMNVECRTTLTSISAYLDGELDALGCQAIERHCRECAACATLVEGLRETIGLCREAGSTPLPEPVRQRARASIERLLASEKPSPT